MLQVTNLTKKFISKTAVDNISFTVKPGVITGLLGPNGAGKTTTMRLLTSYMEPSGGEIFYKGVDVRKNPLDFKKKLGYLPESAPLYPEMLISEYLRYMALARGVEESQVDTQIEKVKTICELESHFETPISFLSKGFKQRVALAGTLIHDPEVIILDEPTSGLDPNQISHIRDLIKKLGKEKTLILSTHILQEVEDICDEVLIISNGKVVANSSVKNLYSNHSVLISSKSNYSEIKKVFTGNDFISVEEHSEEDDGEFKAYIIHLKEFKPESVFRTLQKSNLDVREIKVYRKSLESIFEELTRK